MFHLLQLWERALAFSLIENARVASPRLQGPVLIPCLYCNVGFGAAHLLPVTPTWQLSLQTVFCNASVHSDVGFSLPFWSQSCAKLSNSVKKSLWPGVFNLCNDAPVLLMLLSYLCSHKSCSQQQYVPAAMRHRVFYSVSPTTLFPVNQ